MIQWGIAVLKGFSVPMMTVLLAVFLMVNLGKYATNHMDAMGKLSSQKNAHVFSLVLQIPSRRWFQIYFLFSPLPGEIILFDKYFSNGLVQPPTRPCFEGVLDTR